MTMPGGLLRGALGAFGGQQPGRPMMNPAPAPGAGMAAAPAGAMLGHGAAQMGGRGGMPTLQPPAGLLSQILGAGGPRPHPAPIAQEGPGMMAGAMRPMMPGAPGAPTPTASGPIGSILQRILAAKSGQGIPSPFGHTRPEAFPGQGQGVAGGFPGQGGPFAGAGAGPAAPPRPATPPGANVAGRAQAGSRPLPRGMTVNGRRTY